MPFPLRRCSHCDMTPEMCEQKQDAAERDQRAYIADNFPNTTDERRERSVSAARHIATCCANCLHF